MERESLERNEQLSSLSQSTRETPLTAVTHDIVSIFLRRRLQHGATIEIPSAQSEVSEKDNKGNSK